VSYYIVVEGACAEVKVYPRWISLLNPSLVQVNDVDAVRDGCYYLVSGYGYPNYFSVITNALADMERYTAIRWLVIAVDAELMSYEEKRREIFAFVAKSAVASKIRIIIQNACLETWALGNKLILRRHPQDPTLGQQDPEDLPGLDAENLNRAQFAGVYLKRALRDRYPKLIYSKRNPQVIVHYKFFAQLVKRSERDGHIRSFSDFLATFAPGQILTGSTDFKVEQSA